MTNYEERTSSQAWRRVLHRVKYVVPSSLTLASILCGWYVIISSLKGLQAIADPALAASFFDHASQAIGLAIILDNLDGRTARLIGATSLFGVELDSIADALTFGCAAILLAYTWGFGSLPALQLPAFSITFLFVACGALRLARSNLHANAARADESPSISPRKDNYYFTGLPIPAAAGMIAAIVHFSSVPNGGRLAAGDISAAAAHRWALIVMAITTLLALLMVSTFPYSKLKVRPGGNRSLGALNHVTFPAIALLIAAGVWFNSRWVVLMLATLYVIHGPLLKLGQTFKTQPKVS
jgi:CDP-diacylglycerol--serine O-phosphatidyltransferase